MELNKETISFLQRMIKVAKILKIENIVLDNECCRGHLQEEGVMIIERDSKPKFDFVAMGITRISVLDARLALITRNEFIIEAELKEKENGTSFISKLLLSNERTDVEFKCSDPNFIKAPKLLKDPVTHWFDLTAESIDLLVNAQSAVRGESVTFKGSVKSGVLAKLSDSEGDSLNHILTDTLEVAPGVEVEKISFPYKNAIIIPILKQFKDEEEKIRINITSRGILNVKVNDITVYIAPEK